MNSQLKKSDESKFRLLPRHVHTTSITVMVKMISISNLSEAYRKVIPVQIMTFRETDDSLHLAVKQPKKFAQIHVENCTKFQDAGQQYLLNWTTTVTLFAANIGCHKSCYKTFRAPSWKKTCSQEIYCLERNYIGELVDVIDYVDVLKREIYALRQPRELELYTNRKGVGIDLKQSVDIKKLTEKRLR